VTTRTELPTAPGRDVGAGQVLLAHHPRRPLVREVDHGHLEHVHARLDAGLGLLGVALRHRGPALEGLVGEDDHAAELVEEQLAGDELDPQLGEQLHLVGGPGADDVEVLAGEHVEALPSVLTKSASSTRGPAGWCRCTRGPARFPLPPRPRPWRTEAPPPPSARPERAEHGGAHGEHQPVLDVLLDPSQSSNPARRSSLHRLHLGTELPAHAARRRSPARRSCAGVHASPLCDCGASSALRKAAARGRRSESEARDLRAPARDDRGGRRGSDGGREGGSAPGGAAALCAGSGR
jgi:hypothetical protein